ncbi:hypothetical protein SPHINGO361_120265 [Sphingomonas sp. EC-HK361]|nr:hypothetical protein SPHINGO361_120265 [Sphingomonas sp. EC-HK361]
MLRRNNGETMAVPFGRRKSFIFGAETVACEPQCPDSSVNLWCAAQQFAHAAVVRVPP